MMFVLVLSCKHETSRLDQYPIQGIDVSHYQSRINWDTVAEQGLTFAFVKASEGQTYQDSLFCHNWEEMKRVGLRRGAYHFFRPTVPVSDQIRNFVERVEMQYGDMPPVLDVEVIDGVSKMMLIHGVQEWLRAIEAQYNIKPILYTNLKFYNKLLAGHFDDYPIWIARYNTREPTLACGRDWQFWQHGNRGRLPGITGDVDFNVFKGSIWELDALCFYPHAVLSME